MITLTSWLWLCASILSYGIGEYCSKKVAIQFSWTYAIIIAVCYLGSGAFWIPAMMQRNALILLGIIWTIMATLMTLGIGLCMGETLQLHQSIGVGLALIAAILLAY